MARNRGRRNGGRSRRGGRGASTSVVAVRRTLSRMKSTIAPTRVRIPKDPPPLTLGFRRSGVIKFMVWKKTAKEEEIAYGGLNEPGWIGIDGTKAEAMTYDVKAVDILKGSLYQLVGIQPTSVPLTYTICVRSITLWGGDQSPRVELNVAPSAYGLYPPHMVTDASAKNHKPAVKWTSPVAQWFGSTTAATIVFCTINLGTVEGAGATLIAAGNVATLHIAVDVVSGNTEKLVP